MFSFINDKKKKKNTGSGVEMWVCQETVNQNILKEKKRFPTYPNFFQAVTWTTHIFLFGLG